jgi:tRNA nucleotidyltransferase/poly(A) polymerase
LDAARAPFLADPAVRALFEALNADGEETRIVGGAVRNVLMGKAAGDIDFATTCLPEQAMLRVEMAGFKAVPTGIEHGTVTAVRDGRGFEITTLRADIATDGRHATVRFGRDWAEDAARRDFTINALACDSEGDVHDFHGGLADIETRTIRFIGDAETRIREDHLRALRFYRFFAWHGQGRPDADGIRATAKLKSGVNRLSAERVWSEMKKLLAAPDPARALLWMRQVGVLGEVLPETINWGIDAIPGIIAAEQALGWAPDPLLRLAAITPDDPARRAAMAARLKMANAEGARLTVQAMVAAIPPNTAETAVARLLYFGDVQAIRDRLRLALAAKRVKAAAGDTEAMGDAARFFTLLRFADTWTRPVFPVTGRDLKALGMIEGPEIGARLKELELCWVESGFRLTKAELLDRV